MSRFLDAIRIQDANAFVINILRAEGTPPPKASVPAAAAAAAAAAATYFSSSPPYLSQPAGVGTNPVDTVEPAGTKQGDAAAGSHWDDTLPTRWEWIPSANKWHHTKFVFHLTTVLYLQVSQALPLPFLSKQRLTQLLARPLPVHGSTSAGTSRHGWGPVYN